jgi:hypothetical protein
MIADKFDQDSCLVAEIEQLSNHDFIQDIAKVLDFIQG